MELYYTEDGKVSKYIHDNGAETTIKTTSSCNNTLNKTTGEIETIKNDKNKFSVFISSSVGCPLGCKFCYLTQNKFPYRKLSSKEIIDNVKEALISEIEHNPSIRKKYIKLSWMGMGDALLLEPYTFRKINEEILDWVLGDMGFAWGLDGIDLSTILPKAQHKGGWPHQLSNLNDYCNHSHRMNPANTFRSAVRLFYSLHFLDHRDLYIPGGSPYGVRSDLKYLAKVTDWYGIDLIIHHIFFEGLNDSLGRNFYDDAQQLYSAISKYADGCELRILRYNGCEGSKFRESTNFNELLKLYIDIFPKIKYQISSGSEIKAACGQFIGLTNRKK